MDGWCRYLHGLVSAEGTEFVGLIAGGANALDPFPNRMPTEEFESALRFVADPEDAALLLRWIRPIQAAIEAGASQAHPATYKDLASALNLSSSAAPRSAGASILPGESQVRAQNEDFPPATDLASSGRKSFRQKAAQKRGNENTLAEESKWAADSEQFANLLSRSNA